MVRQAAPHSSASICMTWGTFAIPLGMASPHGEHETEIGNPRQAFHACKLHFTSPNTKLMGAMRSVMMFTDSGTLGVNSDTSPSKVTWYAQSSFTSALTR